MIKLFSCFVLLACASSAVAQAPHACCAKKTDTAQALSCTLTTAELQLRKETVLASLKTKVIERTELDTGWSFRFPGTDEMVDELAEFIKTERHCCAFLSFTLTVAGDKSSADLVLTGPEGAKDVITSELGL